MQFRLTTSTWLYGRGPEVASYVTVLRSLGFQFEPPKSSHVVQRYPGCLTKMEQEPPTLEIATLEELLALQQQLGQDLILSSKDGLALEIYDGRRE